MNETIRDHIVIERSVSKLIGLIAIGAAFLAIGVWLINGGAVDSRGESSVYIGWIGAAFSGLCLLVAIHRLIFGHRKPVELSKQGFWDRRALTQEVPWSAVSRISVWSHRGTSILRIQFTDEAILRNRLTPIGKTTRWLNRPFGLDGVYVASTDLDISFSELRTLFQNYLSEYNPAAAVDIK
jgi:hypothetical protein